MRKTAEPLLLLECGGFLTGYEKDLAFDRDFKGDISFEAMQYMKYDAINIGRYDLYRGIDYLKKAHADYNLPILSSNLVTLEGKPIDGIADYIIKEVDGQRIAIIGIMDVDALNKNEALQKTLRVVAPDVAVENMVNRLKGKADHIILLSHIGHEQTQSLLKYQGHIDLALSCNDKSSTSECEEIENETVEHQGSLLAQADHQGESLGLIEMRASRGKKFALEKSSFISLNKDVAHDITIDHKIKKMQRDERDYRRDFLNSKAYEESMKTLQLSPEEFRKKINDDKKDDEPINATIKIVQDGKVITEQKGTVVEQKK